MNPPPARWQESRNGFLLSDDPARLDRALIHDFLSRETDWARNIPRAVLERALDHSVCLGLYEESGRQIGFARAVTDRATFAYLCDVFVLPAWRGHDLGAWLTDAMARHPELQGLRRWVLVTSTAAGLYAKFGWQPLAAPAKYMERHFPKVYEVPAGE